jgi:mono/diheme cytochrome c family protein
MRRGPGGMALRQLACIFWPAPGLVSLLLGGALILTGCTADPGPEGAPPRAEAAAPPAAAARDRGRELFGRNGCTACHGDRGRGDGQVARSLRRAPRDLADGSSYKQGASAPEIATTIRTGISGGSTMPAYPHLSAQETASLAAFIVSLQTKR